MAKVAMIIDKRDHVATCIAAIKSGETVELMLNAANISVIAFARMHGDVGGHAFAFVVIAVAAAEAAFARTTSTRFRRSVT